MTISQLETGGGGDRLTIFAHDGDDVVSAQGLVPHYSTLTLDAGAGNDTVVSNGDGTYLGGDGNDLVFGGLTSLSEVLDGGTGIDMLDTTSWTGTYVINMVTGVTNFSGESFLNFENIITGNPNIKGIFGSNDNMALGAVEALKAAAKLQDVMVVGFDANPDAAKSILAGEMTASVAQAPQNIGGFGVQALVDLKAGKTIEPVIDTGTVLVTKENAADYQ